MVGVLVFVGVVVGVLVIVGVLVWVGVLVLVEVEVAVGVFTFIEPPVEQMTSKTRLTFIFPYKAPVTPLNFPEYVTVVLAACATDPLQV